MKTNYISNWTALLLTVSGLAVLPLTMSAQNLIVNGSAVTQTGTHYESSSVEAALFIRNGTFNGTNIILTGTGPIGENASNAVRMDSGGALSLYDSTINAANGFGLNTNAVTVYLQNTNVSSELSRGISVYNTASVVMVGGTVSSIASYALFVDNASSFAGTDVSVVSGSNSGVYVNRSGSAVFRGKLQVTADRSAIIATQGGYVDLGEDAHLTGRGGIEVFMSGTVVGTNTEINGGVGGSGHAIGISGTGSGLVSLVNPTAQNSGSGSLISFGGSGTNTVEIAGGSLTASGDSMGIVASGAFNTVKVSDGGSITGDVTVSGSAVLDLTISGQDSSLLGDITQNDDAVVTVTISDGASGQGGINGGNLITGGDSAWTFTDDNHINHSDNQGTLNLGDYDVTFDDLTNDGVININLNNDTGEGGSITVSDTASGTGTIHINATGDGKEDPNKVLPGIVSGDGTEHWQWDPIDWGLEEIVKDGDHFVKKGTSPAGAVLNSAIAVQQSMWFAQQNSLLKRMGDLRYGARASRPLADKDVRVPYNSLIENIWLRSYGQQLNIGSQVAGKAYEQLIYGIDLGTDHKFTISADSDLYLGVYVGYGRSDLDYRTPGTDGELNSYYGGLYATWLHSSGFYIDATFKAASVNNDLKAPYGNTQLKASYSDVNFGGSIEIGKKFTFTDDWFIEPQLQVNYLHILAENYTAGPMTISAQDLDALQFRIGSLFGRTINLTNSGALQPYIKISGVETISSGGTIRNGYQSTRANTDGARAELGAGLIWQLDTNNQLHLDYEASFGDKYDKPWGLTAGYRHQF
ncbi:MAG: autotransporter outer membrane beta-barrel domain-containing protein [Verrucomicrobiales bacterium]|jgi:outer membrane autotransporter protein|nr:autotransporter outer membrane beta-barrel domain-containing protein [Verrucomicrobiales bacterium]